MKRHTMTFMTLRKSNGTPVAGRIRHLRRSQGRSQAVVAGLLGITERYLSLLETGRRTPSIGLLRRIADELGVPVASLLCEDRPGHAPAVPQSAPDLSRVLMGYGSTSSHLPVPNSQLRVRVERAWRIWQT